ncbi:LAME_0E03994g1_1 [Lachancea meyersii CBS 8951]|uniref:LAME_0E03994g1_1 n=1 Tax=Lachancea meyersii CBS 8951 TaxID=1266667 RepID=A0A1G4JH58_9SACH|nr:LAME_0E03994g1_1 [Lachancea meyersii CBS 8951]
MESTSGRKLRSKSPATSNTDGLFDFDRCPGSIAADCKLTVLPRATGAIASELEWDGSAELKRKKQELKQMGELVVEKHSLTYATDGTSFADVTDEKQETAYEADLVPNAAENLLDRPMQTLEINETKKTPNGCDSVRPDPLADELYEVYHRKMQKQEIRMVNQDAVQSELEAERLEGVLEGLESQNWLKTLLKTTVIHNADNLEEIMRKREITQDTIGSMLAKFEALKARIAFLARNGRLKGGKQACSRSRISDDFSSSRIDHYRLPAFGFGDVDLHSDDEEESMSNAEIKAYRKKLREQKFGGTVVMQLRRSTSVNYKFAIVAEPLRSAYIVKCSKAEKAKWSRKAELLPPQVEYYQPFPTQTYSTRQILKPSTANHVQNRSNSPAKPKKRAGVGPASRSGSNTPSKRSKKNRTNKGAH